MSKSKQTIVDLIKRVQYPLEPPGCFTSFTLSPYSKRVIEVAMVMNHRFAFYYWLKWRRERWPDSDPPDLLTVDWHKDIGATDDVEPDKLAALDLSDPNAIALYCWVGLHPQNDGQILPALHLNALRDVHAIIKQHWESYWENKPATYTDCNGTEHRLCFYRTPKQYAKASDRAPSGRPVVLDLDLDYFVRQHSSGDHHRQIKMADSWIREVLDPRGPLMSDVLPRLVGMTIALEPEHCGGIANCMHVLGVVSDTLFTRPLLHADCAWRT